jgi:glycosyltransferase involved in cell wall biosynthesis
VKVLHVIPSLSAAHGGPSKALAMMEQALRRQGVDVETATTDDDGPGRRVRKELGVPLQEAGAVHWYFGKSTEFYKVSPSFARWITSEVDRYDLVHIHALFSFASTVAAWAARRARVPYVLRPLGTLNDYGLSRRRPALKSMSIRFVEGPMLRAAAAVHFTSEAEAVEARHLGIPMKEAVIPLAADPADVPATRAARTDPNVIRLLFLSRLDAKKNVEGLLSALASLQSDLPRLHLDIAGDGAPEYVGRLKTHAEGLGVCAQVSWLGHVEGQAKAHALAGADVFVLPSYSENFGIAAAEALAAGLPCVLGEGVAIANDVVQAGAGIAVGTDAASIAQGLRRIIADHESLPALSANAVRLARERYSIEAMGASLTRLYKDILRR